MERLDIHLMGREYSVTVKPEERESLQAAVALVDEKMQQLAGKTTSGGELLAVMTALNIAHEFIQSRAGGGVDLAGSRRRISAMAEHIDDALAKQEKLF
ncbi:cell division protein ZapA [Uliginosibacterium sp. H1]|uniref:cell division protein ZapA n=1 Tax=Uliginosibacterium sp. H1 TaxID=3114757 RepID=UPI002E195994|nr:cell division protein ZapA [Uliginosibacterium sp. H1]